MEGEGRVETEREYKRSLGHNSNNNVLKTCGQVFDLFAVLNFVILHSHCTITEQKLRELVRSLGCDSVRVI